MAEGNKHFTEQLGEIKNEDGEGAGWGLPLSHCTCKETLVWHGQIISEHWGELRDQRSSFDDLMSDNNNAMREMACEISDLKKKCEDLERTVVTLSAARPLGGGDMPHSLSPTLTLGGAPTIITCAGFSLPNFDGKPSEDAHQFLERFEHTLRRRSVPEANWLEHLDGSLRGHVQYVQFLVRFQTGLSCLF